MQGSYSKIENYGFLAAVILFEKVIRFLINFYTIGLKKIFLPKLSK